MHKCYNTWATQLVPSTVALAKDIDRVDVTEVFVMGKILPITLHIARDHKLIIYRNHLPHKSLLVGFEAQRRTKQINLWSTGVSFYVPVQ